MAELFSTFQEFKGYIGGRMNQSVSLDSLAPTIKEAAQRHLVPWLGVTLYNRLVAGSGLSSQEQELKPLVQKSLALLTVWEYAKFANVEFGESGMHRIESNERKSAYRYQERALLEDALSKGYEAMELMLKYLDDNKGAASFTAWAASDEGLAHRTPLLNYTYDFRRLAVADMDRYTFECIRPIINEIELFSTSRIVPAAFWSAFKVKHLAGTLNTAEKQLRTYMRTAIAHRAITEAVRLRWVSVAGGRVSVLEDFGDQRNTNQTMPSSTGSGLYLAHETSSDRYTSQWVDYIKSNPDEFAVVFDVASGGTNTGADAWHINTTDEQSTAEALIVTNNKRPIFRM